MNRMRQGCKFIRKITGRVLATSVALSLLLAETVAAAPGVFVQQELDVTRADADASSVTSSSAPASTPARDTYAGTESLASSQEVSDEDVTEEEALWSAAPTTEEETVPNSPPMIDAEETPADDLFPCLTEELSESQQDEKELLSEHMDEITESEETSYVENQIMVKAETEEQAQQYAEAYNGTLLHYEYGLALIELNADETMEYATVEDAVSKSAQADIQLPAAWPNYLGKMTATYLDPYLSLYDANYQYQHELLESELAWEAGYTGKGVKVCVFDTGVLASHSDLNIKGQAYYKNHATGIVGGSAPDSTGHGTHVAGIIGAKGNGQMGVGIAPEADLYTIGVYDTATGEAPAYALICGLHYALGNWIPDVINCSVAYYGYDPYMEEVINLAYDKGAAIFCAAGNDGSNQVVYPAGFANTISVGAVDSYNKPAYFSNSGSDVRYSGPGVDVVSTYKGSSTSYRTMTGTSQASACVAGAAAVILGSGRIEGTGPARVKNLLDLMDKSCVRSGIGKGTINLRMALGLTRKPSVPAAPTATPSQTFTTENTSVVVDTEPGTFIYYTINGANPTYKNGEIVGTKLNQSVHTIRIEGVDKAVLKMIAVNLTTGVCSKMSTYTYYFKPKVNKVTVYSPSGIVKVAKGGSLKLDAAVLPANAGNPKLKWQVVGFPTGVTVTNGTVKVGAQTTVERFTVMAVSTDGSGISGTIELQVAAGVKVSGITTNVKKNKMTLWVGDYASASQTAQITVKLADKTIGKASDYTQWKSLNTSIATCVLSGDTLTVTGRSKGSTTIQGIAKDGSGRTCNITVVVKQYVTSVAVNPVPGGQLKVGGSMQLSATVSPQNAENKKVSYALTTVPYGTTVKTCGVSLTANGKLKAGKLAVPGTYGITATAVDRNTLKSVEYKLTVTNTGIEKLELNKNTDRIFRVTNGTGAPDKTVFDIKLTGGSSNALTISNSAPGIVTVSRTGLKVTVEATGKGIGTANITVATTDGSNLKQVCKVSVCNPPTKLRLSLPGGHSQYLAYGTSLSLQPKVYGDKGVLDKSASTYTWESSNSSAVSVDSRGVITSKLVNGSDKAVTITCRTADGSNLSATYLIYPTGNTRRMEAEWEEGYQRFILTGYCDTAGALVGDDYLVKVSGNGLSADVTTARTGTVYLNVYPRKAGTYTITVTKADGSKGKCITKVTAK